MFFSQKENVKGIQRNPEELNSYFWQARGYIEDSYGPPSPTAQLAIKKVEGATNQLLQRIDALLDSPWKTYKEAAEKIPYSLFKE